MMAALLATACGHRATQGNGTGTDSTAADSAMVTEALSTDSIGLAREDSMVSVRISVDWPHDGSEALTASIRQYICHELAAGLSPEGEPDVKLYSDGKEAVKATVDQHYADLAGGWKEARANGIPFDGMQYLYSLRVNKTDETDRYVSFVSVSESYMGGAHGSAVSSGTTFSKLNGQRIGYDTRYNAKTDRYERANQTLFSKPDDPKLAALIKEGVRSYFTEAGETAVSDEELKDLLIGVSHVDSIPLPSNPPLFTREGLVFTYQQYEIAPYAAGIINFSLPYDKVLPFMTDEAAKLVK